MPTVISIVYIRKLMADFKELTVYSKIKCAKFNNSIFDIFNTYFSFEIIKHD